MKRLYIFVLLSIVSLFSIEAFAIDKPKSQVQKESLQYNIYYHKGFIWMKAGRGSLILNEEKMPDGQTLMHGTIYGRSLNIVETFFTVRDTMDTWFTPEYIPIEYHKITNEGSYHTTEKFTYKTFFNGKKPTMANVDSTMVDILKWRKKTNTTDTIQLHEKGAVYDMFSIFYLVRGLDFKNMKVGTVKRFPIFEGSKHRVVKMTFMGESESKYRGGGKLKGYQVDLAFDVDGEDGVPMNVWLSTDENHTPMNIIIHLKRIGSIQCEIAQD